VKKYDATILVNIEASYSVEADNENHAKSIVLWRFLLDPQTPSEGMMMVKTKHDPDYKDHEDVVFIYEMDKNKNWRDLERPK
jgi:hypothetical protein